MSSRYWIPALMVLFIAIGSCDDDDAIDENGYDPKPYALTVPDGFPPMDIPGDNPLTVKGVELGRMLFHDPILSADGSQSCASCHAQDFAFTDKNLRFSVGIDGLSGDRNAMAIINLGWSSSFFWDGRAGSLEEQALGPVVNPIEMHNTWTNAVAQLQAHPDYPKRFFQAFGTDQIDSMLVVKAIAQFERTFISSDSPFDLRERGEGNMSAAARRGEILFITEKGDCFHCHPPSGMLFTDDRFHNNGLDSVFSDIGLGKITGNPNDNGKFKTPTLRNVEFTAPYMHDGRFQTLEEVVEFYTSGVTISPTIDPLMTKVNGRADLTDQDKADLVAFLKALSDSKFTSNSGFFSPF